MIATLKQRGVFNIIQDPNMKTAVKSEDLADVTNQDIKTASYTLLMDKTRLMTDEIGWAKGWMHAKPTGLPSTQVYVYPGSHEDATTEPIAVAAGYVGARGSASMNPSPNAATLLSTGYNIQNILSQGMVPNWQNLTRTQLENRVWAMVFKSAVWGVPIGLFWHMNELSGDEVSNLLDDLKVAGATLKSDTQLVSLLGNGLLRDNRNPVINSRTATRRSISNCTKFSSASHSFPYHSGGISPAAAQILSSSIFSIRDSRGSNDSHPRTPTSTSCPAYTPPRGKSDHA